jgi:hypothetical protein
MQNHLNSCDEELSMVPNVRVSTIANESDLYWKLRYLAKPINLASRYRQEFSLLPETRLGAIRLNSNVRDLLSGLTEVTKGRYQLRRKGTLRPGTQHFIGIPSATREQYREYVEEFESALTSTEQVDDDP